MKIFISWSGARSRAVAEVLNEWIKCVLQVSRPWLSTRDIDRGALWFTEINEQLKDTGVGIVCLTQENKDKPWILFESGALAKGLSTNRVCTFLIDLQPADLDDPLAQFNHTLPNHDGLWQLIHTLNACLGSNGLDEKILVQVYETYWPQFEEKFTAALAKHPQNEKPKPRSQDEVLNLILENTRSLNQRISKLEGVTLPTKKKSAPLEGQSFKLWDDIKIIVSGGQVSVELPPGVELTDQRKWEIMQHFREQGLRRFRFGFPNGSIQVHTMDDLGNSLLS